MSEPRTPHAEPGAGPAGAPAPAAWSSAASAAWAVALHEFRRLRHGRHAIAGLALAAMPVVFAALAVAILASMADRAFVEPVIMPDERRTIGAELMLIARTFRFFILPVVLFLGSANVFAQLYHGELSDRTLHHLFLLPVRREIITVGKYVAGILAVGISSIGAWALACAILLSLHGPSAAIGAAASADGVKAMLSYGAMLALGAAAYGALFLFFGTVASSPALLTVGFWCWESLTAFLPTGFKRATISHWLTSLMPVSVVRDAPFLMVADPEHPAVAILALVLISLVFLAAATWRVRHLQVSYGASQ